ncbi:MAG: C4-dicarboxylate transporter DctA [Myxococcaceae bacterium]
MVLRLLRSLYIQVLIAVILGTLVGHFFPTTGVALEPLGDGFIKLIKMLVAPVIFTTVVHGIARVSDLKSAGRVGLKALVYFEVVTTFALFIGLVIGEAVRPGDGITQKLPTEMPEKLKEYVAAGQSLSVSDFFSHLIPGSLFEPFVKGDILQVLLISILVGVVLARMRELGAPLVRGIELLNQLLFGMVGIVMRLAPIGAFGAIAFTVGKIGLHTLVSLGKLVVCFYATALLFVVLVLGAICRWVGISVLHLARYLRDELLLVLGTSSSESALPRLMAKMKAAGCDESIVGLVIPMGYSFNLDGTSIYLTLASLFVAQATGTHLSLGEELALLGVLLLTSKGAAAVTGAGFITLAATLSAVGHIPLIGLAMLLGVDRFMSEVRALTNLMGNAVATLVLSKWEGKLDLQRARDVLSRPAPVSLSEVEGASER